MKIDHDRHHSKVKTFVINWVIVCVFPILGIHINVAFRYLTHGKLASLDSITIK